MVIPGLETRTTQGLESNEISSNTAIRCNNNNGSFISNRAQTHDSAMSDLEADLESDHVDFSQIF